jgi:hypothetical protein
MNKYLRQLLLTIAGIYLILMGSFISPAFAQVSYTPPYSIGECSTRYSI